MPDCSQYNEKALLAEVAAVDECAFRKLFDLNKERFYTVVLKMTRSDEEAEDIVQDVFMHIWTTRAVLVNIDNPSSYFFKAVAVFWAEFSMNNWSKYLPKSGYYFISIRQKTFPTGGELIIQH